MNADELKMINGATLRNEFKRANATSLYEPFDSFVHDSVNYLVSKPELVYHHTMLNDFFKAFKISFEKWKGYLEMLGYIPNYRGQFLDQLNLALWDFEYANDPNGNLSPFGRWLAEIGRALDGAKIGVLNALNQQLNHQSKENLNKAQKLAVDMYSHFLNFIDSNGISGLKPDHEHPPVVQLYAGGAVTCLKDLPVPTLICMNQLKAGNFSGFSALPHEFGHDVSGTFKGDALVDELVEKIGNLNIPYRQYWQLWTEECFADAIGILAIKEGEIISLANLFSRYFTNIILPDETEPRPDEHPNRHLRVLLTIEVGRLIGIDSETLDELEEKWISFGKSKNTSVPPEFVYDKFNERLLPMADFLQSLKQIAEILVNTECENLNGKKVREIYEDFDSELANELKNSITPENWQ